MAKKIAVYEPSQRVTDNPTTYVKKCVALLLIRRLVAEWVIPGVMIRRLTVSAPLDIRSCRIQTPHNPYIPEKLPPAEVSGCHFQPPMPSEVFPPSHYSA